MFLAINELVKEKARFILIVAVIALVSYLTFFLTALAYGLARMACDGHLDEWTASGPGGGEAMSAALSFFVQLLEGGPSAG